MEATAVVLEAPERLGLQRLALTEPTAADAIVAVRWSGVSTGTERLLWSGRMPSFPGMGYPLVPGYESVGEVMEAAAGSGLKAGDRVRETPKLAGGRGGVKPDFALAGGKDPAKISAALDKAREVAAVVK